MNRKVTNSLKESALFIKHAFKSPKEVAYLFPSSPWLIRAVAKNANLGEAMRVIELGPGIGGTTKGLLKEMHPDAHMITVEINQKFAQHIEKSIVDSRLTVSAEGAQNLADILAQQDWEHVDVVISGIPFSTLPDGMDKAIMKAVHAALKPGGMFLAYQFRDHVSKVANPFFGDPQINKTEYKNLPPMRIYTWLK